MNKTLRNIIIVYDYAEINGGAAKVAIQSAIELSKTEYNVYFFSAVAPVNEELKKSNCNVKCLGLEDINAGKKVSMIFRGVSNNIVKKQFTSYLHSFSPDDTVIHVHGWVKALSSVVISVACKHGFKTIVTLHDYFTVCPNGGLYDFHNQRLCTYRPMSLKCILCNCDKRNYLQKIWRVARQVIQDRNVKNNPLITYISISQKNELNIRPYVESKKIIRVENPVDVSDHPVANVTASNIFLYIGRLSEEKGIELFCRAITRLKENYNIEGIVVGDGVLHNSLKSKYPDIVFEGWKNPREVKEYLQNARAFVLPSKCLEGAPLTIIEAMSAGIPCIVSDSTSAIEIVEDGVNGYVFRSDDLESIMYAIERALNDDDLETIHKNIVDGFEKNRYLNTVHVEKIISVYKNVL